MKSIYLQILMASFLLSMGVTANDGRSILAENEKFFYCLVEKASLTAQERQEYISRYRSHKDEMEATVSKIDSACSSEELVKVNGLAQCFRDGCENAGTGFKLTKKMEEIMKACGTDAVLSGVSLGCRDSLPFGSPRPAR